MSWIPYEPGARTADNPADRSGYSTVNAALWYAYADVFYARMYGFDRTRHPEPGAPIDQERYQRWRRRLQVDMHRNLWGSKMPVEEPVDQGAVPEHAWQYFYQRCLHASGG